MTEAYRMIVEDVEKKSRDKDIERAIKLYKRGLSYEAIIEDFEFDEASIAIFREKINLK